MENNLAKTL